MIQCRRFIFGVELLEREYYVIWKNVTRQLYNIEWE